MLPLAFKTDSEYSSEYYPFLHLLRFVVPRSTTVTEKKSSNPNVLDSKNACNHPITYNQDAVEKYTNIGFSVFAE